MRLNVLRTCLRMMTAMLAMNARVAWTKPEKDSWLFYRAGRIRRHAPRPDRRDTTPGRLYRHRAVQPQSFACSAPAIRPLARSTRRRMACPSTPSSPPDPTSVKKRRARVMAV